MKKELLDSGGRASDSDIARLRTDVVLRGTAQGFRLVDSAWTSLNNSRFKRTQKIPVQVVTGVQ